MTVKTIIQDHWQSISMKLKSNIQEDFIQAVLLDPTML